MELVRSLFATDPLAALVEQPASAKATTTHIVDRREHLMQIRHDYLQPSPREGEDSTNAGDYRCVPAALRPRQQERCRTTRTDDLS